MNKESLLKQEVISDREVIVRILQGEKELYAIIVRRYNQRLYRVAMSMLNDDSDVEDAMQVAYIHGYEGLKTFGFRAGFGTWLTRILINECLLRIRRRSRSISMNDQNMENLMIKKTAPDVSADKLLNGELKAILNGAILSLPQAYRTVFILREVENMSVAETQQCLNISEANVKVRLNRAKAMLKDLLSLRYKKEEILHFHLSRCDRMVEAVMKFVRAN